LEKEALFRRALNKVAPRKDRDEFGAPPGAPAGGQPLYHRVSGSADGPRITYDMGPPQRRGILWWDKDWLFVVRTGGEERPAEFLKKYLAALNAPAAER
jgi:hypothetical protein